MFSHFTASARRVMQRAFREAKRGQHDFVGTEHLLFGLLCDAEGPAVALLRSLGAKPELMLDKVELSLHRHDAGLALEQFPISPASRRVFAAALEEAGRFRHQLIGPEHLLLGLLRDSECEAAQILGMHGVTHAAVGAAVAALPMESFREAQIQTGDEPRGSLGENPSVDELDRWLAPEVTHDTTTGDPATTGITGWGAIFTIHEVEAQLRRTQLVFAFVLGYAYGHWLAGWVLGLVMGIAALCVALFRSTWVGLTVGAMCGLFLTPIFHQDLSHPLAPVWVGLLGAFLGSFLGDGWRFHWRPPPTNVANENQVDKQDEQSA